MSTALAAVLIALPGPGSAPPARAMGGSDSPSSASTAESVDLRQGQAAIAARNWEEAIRRLDRVVAADPRNADALNGLGYANRNLGRHEASMTWYRRALAVDAGHKGALEYQGELFLTLGDLSGAEANLATLARVCSRSCEEFRELEAAIAKHKAAPAAAIR